MQLLSSIELQNNTTMRENMKRYMKSTNVWDELDALGVSEEGVDRIANKLGYHYGLDTYDAYEVLNYFKSRVA